MQLDTRLPLLAAQQPALQFQPETRLESLGKIAPAINAMRQMQAQQIDMQTELRKRQAFDQFRSAAQQAGLSGDLGQLAQVFFTHGQSPEHFKIGTDLMKASQEEARNRRLFGPSGDGVPAGDMPAARPAAAAPATIQAPASEVAPEMAFGAAGGAQPVNALMAMEAPAPAMPAQTAAPQGYLFAGRTYSAAAVQEMLARPDTRSLGLEIIKANEQKRETTPEKLRLMQSLGYPMTRKGFADFEEAQRAPQRQTSEFENYLNAKKDDGFTGTFYQYQEKLRKAGASSVVAGPQEKSFETALGSGQAKKLLEDKAVADDAKDIISTVQQGRQLLKSGMITGFGAEFITQVGAALNQAGINFAEDRVANTQAFTANMAANVGRIIKQFGAGTGLSNADREYAEKMAGGKVTLDRKAIERILEINERAARNVIKLHNERVKDIKTNIPLTVEMPTVQAPPPPAGTTSRPPLQQIFGR